MKHLTLFAILCVSPTLAPGAESFSPDSLWSPPDSALMELITNPVNWDSLDVDEFVRRHYETFRMIRAGVPSPAFSVLRYASSFFLWYVGSGSQFGYDEVVWHRLFGDRLYVRAPVGDDELVEAVENSVGDAYDDVAVGWGQLGLKPPDGLIYVWFLSSLKKMQQAFGTSETTTGFAQPCRTIVIPYRIVTGEANSELRRDMTSEGVSGFQFDYAIREFNQEHLYEVCKHELVHVFINATLGFARSRQVDRWFHESMAILLSDQDRDALVDEYRSYGRMADYLRMRYGVSRFARFVSHAVQTGSPTGALMHEYEIRSAELLEVYADEWYRYKRMFEWLTGAALCILLYGAWRSKDRRAAYLLGALSIAAAFWLAFGSYSSWTYSVAGTYAICAITIAMVLAWPAERLWRLRTGVTIGPVEGSERTSPWRGDDYRLGDAAGDERPEASESPSAATDRSFERDDTHVATPEARAPEGAIPRSSRAEADRVAQLARRLTKAIEAESSSFVESEATLQELERAGWNVGERGEHHLGELRRAEELAREGHLASALQLVEALTEQRREMDAAANRLSDAERLALRALDRARSAAPDMLVPIVDELEHDLRAMPGEGLNPYEAQSVSLLDDIRYKAEAIRAMRPGLNESEALLQKLARNGWNVDVTKETLGGLRQELRRAGTLVRDGHPTRAREVVGSLRDEHRKMDSAARRLLDAERRALQALDKARSDVPDALVPIVEELENDLRELRCVVLDTDEQQPASMLDGVRNKAEAVWDMRTGLTGSEALLKEMERNGWNVEVPTGTLGKLRLELRRAGTLARDGQLTSAREAVRSLRAEHGKMDSAARRLLDAEQLALQALANARSDVPAVLVPIVEELEHELREIRREALDADERLPVSLLEAVKNRAEAVWGMRTDLTESEALLQQLERNGWNVDVPNETLGALRRELRRAGTLMRDGRQVRARRVLAFLREEHQKMDSAARQLLAAEKEAHTALDEASSVAMDRLRPTVANLAHELRHVRLHVLDLHDLQPVALLMDIVEGATEVSALASRRGPTEDDDIDGDSESSWWTEDDDPDE